MAISSGLSLLQAILAPLAAAEGVPPADRQATLAEDVIVTAQRRRERRQDVPIALSVLGEEQLARRGARDLSDLVGAVPGLSIAGFTGGNASNLVSIRGVAGQVLPIGSGQPVAIYLDGVYLSRPDAAFFGLDDVERIEVLRGPQGALYGRNATAGAINIITRQPGATAQGGGELRRGDLGPGLYQRSLVGAAVGRIVGQLPSPRRRDPQLRHR